MSGRTWLGIGVLGMAVASFATLGLSQSTRRTLPDGSERVRAVLTGGHETDPRDGGRPVRLVAAGLGVPEEVFREVFKGVRPARDHRPSGEEQRRNKEVLMRGLAKYGVSNDRLDEVSNYYRYRPQEGELWRHEDAEVEAIVKDGKVTGFEIVKGGAGYMSGPEVTVPGVEGKWEAVVEFGKDLKTNGEVVRVVEKKGA